MGTSQEILKISIETQARLRALRQAEKELARLGGKTAVDAQKNLNKVNREISLLSGESKKGSIFFSRFTQGIAIGNIAADAAIKSLDLLKKGIVEIGKATLVAAQISELGNVYDFVGRRAGYTSEQLNKYKFSLLASGIAQKESNQSLLRGIQAQIDLNDVVKLGRIAQDAAVIGLTDSSEAHVELLESVARLEPRLLKKYGIIVDLNQVYPDYAKSIGKVTTELTESEKKQAFLNAIYERGTRITGAYETAMNSASKRMRSLNRLFQDAQQVIGQNFEPALLSAVKVAESALKTFVELSASVEFSTSKFFAQKKQMEDNTTATLQLTKRYDELSQKSSLNNYEQLEFNGLLEQLSKIFPTAITNWSEYGTAIGISTEKIRSNIDAQRALFRLQQAEQIDNLKKRWAEIRQELKELDQQILTTTTPRMTLMGNKIIQTGVNVDDLKTKIAQLKAEQNDLVIALGLGFDAVNDFATADSALGNELAITLALLQGHNAEIEKMTESTNMASESVGQLEVRMGRLELATINTTEAIEDYSDSTDEAADSSTDLGEEGSDTMEKISDSTRTAINAVADLIKMLSGGTFSFAGLARIIGSFVSLSNPVAGLAISTIGGALPFDDPFNDNALIRESRRIGEFTAKGIAQSNLNNMQQPAMGQNSSGNSINIDKIIINTKSSNPKEIAKEIENLKVKNFTNININRARITR